MCKFRKYLNPNVNNWIDENISTTFEGFIEQAIQFYDACGKNLDSLPGVLKIALTNEKIQERLDSLSELRRLNEAQESAKGNAQVARKERDDTYRELRIAWENFKIVCRHIFRDDKEYLNILNIKPKKTKKPAQEPEKEEIQENPAETS